MKYFEKDFTKIWGIALLALLLLSSIAGIILMYFAYYMNGSFLFLLGIIIYIYLSKKESVDFAVIQNWVMVVLGLMLFVAGNLLRYWNIYNYYIVSDYNILNFIGFFLFLIFSLKQIFSSSLIEMSKQREPILMERKSAFKEVPVNKAVPQYSEYSHESSPETQFDAVVDRQLNRLVELEKHITALKKDNLTDISKIKQLQSKYESSVQDDTDLLRSAIAYLVEINGKTTLEGLIKIINYKDYEEVLEELKNKDKKLQYLLNKVISDKNDFTEFRSYLNKIYMEFAELNKENEQIKKRAKDLHTIYQNYLLKGEDQRIDYLAQEIESEKQEWQKLGLHRIQFVKNLFDGIEVGPDEFKERTVYLSKSLRLNERLITALSRLK